MKKNNYVLKQIDIIFIVVALMSFSIGIWGNFRSLWLEDNLFKVTGISLLISVGMICSSIISVIISIFSNKVKTKAVIVMTLVFRVIALCILFFINKSDNTLMIKSMVILSIMCETIFAIGIYPLITTVDKSEETYRKYALIDFISMDIGIVFCGFLIGQVIGSYVVDYNTCLLFSLISSGIAIMFLLAFKGSKSKKIEKDESVLYSISKLFKNKMQRIYFSFQILSSISYDVVFGLILLILIKYLRFGVNVASLFLLITGVSATVIASLFLTKIKIKNPKNAIIIKFGFRIITYLLAFIYPNGMFPVVAITFAIVTSKLLDDKINGIYINLIDEKYQFIHSNLRFFMARMGSAIGIALCGYLLNISLSYVFLLATILTSTQVILGIFMSKHYNRHYS